VNSVSTAPSSAPATPEPSRWTPARLTIVALVANAVLYIFLILVMTLVDKDKLLIPLPIIVVGDLVLAAVLFRAPRRWAFVLAAAFLLIMMLGTLPHDLPQVTHPAGIDRFIFGVLALIVPPVGIVASIQSARTDRRFRDQVD